MSQPIDWFDQGAQQFVASQIRPEKPPMRYPTQDIYSPKDEADYVAGFNSAKAAFERGDGFSGMESLAEELEEQRRREAEEKRYD
jgi:hypothetical protein